MDRIDEKIKTVLNEKQHPFNDADWNAINVKLSGIHSSSPLAAIDMSAIPKKLEQYNIKPVYLLVAIVAIIGLFLYIGNQEEEAIVSEPTEEHTVENEGLENPIPVEDNLSRTDTIENLANGEIIDTTLKANESNEIIANNTIDSSKIITAPKPAKAVEPKAVATQSKPKAEKAEQKIVKTVASPIKQEPKKTTSPVIKEPTLKKAEVPIVKPKPAPKKAETPIVKPDPAPKKVEVPVVKPEPAPKKVEVPATKPTPHKSGSFEEVTE